MAQEVINGAASDANGGRVEYVFGRYRLNNNSLTLLYRDIALPLAPKVVKTLVALLDNAGSVVSKDELLRFVWDDCIIDEANLSQNIYTLRRAFEETSNDQFIETLPRRGYRFVGSVAKRPIVAKTVPQSARVRWLLSAVAAVLLCTTIAIRFQSVEKAPVAATSHMSPAAAQEYALGWYYWRDSTAASQHESVRHFDLVINGAPRSPLGYAGKAAAYTKLADIYEGSASGVAAGVTAWKLSQQALELNPNSAEALAVRGFIEYDLDGDNNAAAADLRRAVRLQPDFAVAHVWYGATLLWQGNPKAARVELERAASLDSRLPSLYYLLALDFYMSRDYKNAIAFGKLATADYWTSDFSRYLLAAAHDEAGQYQSAIDDVRERSSSSSDALAVSATLAHVYASMGKRTSARQELRAVERLAERYQHRPVLTAIAYVANDRPDEAFAWLSRLHRSDRRLFGLDPRLDPLRHDRRFAQWLHG